jgi:predicted GNAT superfamily acetyltransferase
MAGPTERSAPLEFRFRRLAKPEEFRAAERIQEEAWGLAEEPPVPTPLQRALQDNGGLVLGAFLDIHLVGMSIGFLGWDGARLFHYSHMTAVRPPYQNHGVGFRLKAYQREEVLRQGLPEIRWTFDPLRSRNAMLNVRRLGGVPDRYLVDYYGQMGSDANRDLETDRLRLVWALDTPHVAERLAGTRPSAAEDEARFRAAAPIVETEVGELGFRRPVQVAEPDRPMAHLEIPFDLDALREHEPKTVPTWRHAVRDGFRAAFDLGYVVDDFAVVRAEHERRSVYFFRKPVEGEGRPPAGTAAPPPAEPSSPRATP